MWKEPSPGSADAGASQRISRPPLPAPPHGSSSPISACSQGKSPVNDSRSIIQIRVLRSRTETQHLYPRMMFWTGAQRPQKPSFSGVNWFVVDASFAASHQPIFIKFPLFVAIGPKPLAICTPVFILKPHSDTIIDKCPKRLGKPIFQLPFPLSLEKRDNRSAPHEKFISVAPGAVFSIRASHAHRISGVPSIFRKTNFERRALRIKRWKRGLLDGHGNHLKFLT